MLGQFVENPPLEVGARQVVLRPKEDSPECHVVTKCRLNGTLFHPSIVAKGMEFCPLRGISASILHPIKKPPDGGVSPIVADFLSCNISDAR